MILRVDKYVMMQSIENDVRDSFQKEGSSGPFQCTSTNIFHMGNITVLSHIISIEWCVQSRSCANVWTSLRRFICHTGCSGYYGRFSEET